MRIYLDTEFTNFAGPATELISLALAAEDGQEFYAERNDFNRNKCSNFTREIVLPLLAAPGVQQLDRANLKVAVRDWLCSIPNPEVAVDFDGDWYLLCGLLEDDAPDDLSVVNVRALLDPRILEDFYVRNGVPRHHALHDARANRYAASYERARHGGVRNKSHG